MKFNRLHHVSLNVDDLAAAEGFYSDVLGFESVPRPDLGIPGVWLGAGEQQIHLIEVADWNPSSGPHFALRVDNLDAAITELVEHDVRVSEVFDIVGVCRQAFFHDPSGNTIEVNEPTK